MQKNAIWIYVAIEQEIAKHLSVRGSIHRQCVWPENYPFGKYPSRKCPSGMCLVEEMTFGEVCLGEVSGRERMHWVCVWL